MMENIEPERISDHLFLLRDTCNVYIVRDGDHALLVDSGSGSALQHLDDLGISTIDWILHTHHHRDQCQGDHLMPHETRIAVPFHERPLFDEAENFWRNKQIYDSYNNQSTYFTLTRNVEVDQALRDYETFRWKDLEFFVLPALGHTHGSVSLLSEIDGLRAAFTGDLIHSPGKVWSLTELQHSYGGPEGINLNSFSLRDLGSEDPGILLPSHGDPMRNPKEAINQTIENLRKYYDYLTGQPLTIDRTFKRVLPHLLVSEHSCCTFYVLLSDSGKALFVDYGAASTDHFYSHLRQFESWEIQRFVEHSLRALKDDYGVKSIDVVIPTHYHDDHTCGIPHLQRRYGVNLWALEQMVNILEHPQEYNIPCLLPYPMKVDRCIGDGEEVEWEEYSLKIVHFPGQTEYHMAMAVDIDGKRVAFTGDSIAEAGNTLLQPIIHRNIVTAESHMKCARNLSGLEPDMLAHGHGGCHEVGRKKIGTLMERAKRTREMFEMLLPDPSELGVNPGWIRLVPYQSSVGTGQSIELNLEIHNYHRHTIRVEADLVLPDRWVSSPRAGVQVESGETLRLPFEVRVGQIPGMYAIAADLTIDAKRMGQVPEAIVTVN
jgi:glyoxylase-like metal-dependent hydrolase (beta-lactamase superfamily II)